MYGEDILVVLYPNKQNLKSILIIDPFDKKMLSFDISSLDEVKEILMKNLPFCSQNHEPMLHFGSAYILEWEGLPSNKIEIHSPQDIDKVLS